MPEKKKLPVGIDNFEKIIKNNFYYVDKTEMIHSLIQNCAYCEAKRPDLRSKTVAFRF